MRLRDLRIGTLLRICLGAILGLTIALAALAWAQGDALWQQTEQLYSHPFQVRRTTDELQLHVLSMYVGMRDLCGVATERERVAILGDLAEQEVHALEDLELLRDRYLGAPEDVERARESFVAWNATRAETIGLVREGRLEEARAQTGPGGVCSREQQAVSQRLDVISRFAARRADAFYRTAAAHRESLARRLAGGVAAILLLSLVVAAFLVRRLQVPVAELVSVADQLRDGKLTARSTLDSTNELGVLAGSLNAMAEALAAELETKQRAAELASAMLRAVDARAFYRELLKALMASTGSQVGAVYCLDDAKAEYRHFESLGLSADARTSFSATDLEGELGAAVATREIQHLADIPADTRFTFATVSGGLIPREILTIPVVSGEDVAVVLSLASVRAYSPQALRLVRDAWDVVSARVHGVMAFQRVELLAERLRQQNRELDAQQSELTAQTHELTAQNVELAQQKQQVDEAHRVKTAFLSNMSHELRTPLNSVIALAGVLRRRLATTLPAEERSYLEVIERNGKSLLALINDVLDLSRLEAGGEPLRLARFSVRDLTDELVAMLGPLAREKGIALHNAVGADLPPLVSDAEKCHHILQNLLANAIKFTEQGHVTLEAAVERGELRLSVRDSGIGIASDQLSFIFEEFRQADDTTSRRYGGTGLGLSIARKYARVLGGEVEVSSVLGEGSTFTLRLPLESRASGSVDERGLRTTRSSRPVRAQAGRGERILLVEDTEPAIIQMTDILEAEGYRVDVARDGKTALELLSRTLPDAVLLDLMMPGVDGFAVLRELRAVPRTSVLPVLILTAKHVTPEELSFLRGNHVSELIQKGDIDKAGLLAAVAAMVTPRAPNTPLPPPRSRGSVPAKAEGKS